MKKIIQFLGLFLFALAAKLMPFNYIVGSYSATFSWTTIAAPIMAFQFGLSTIVFLLCSKKMFSLSLLPLLLLHRLPLVCSAIAFKNRNVITSIGIPLFCMALFIFHSVGGQAWIYSLYWLIPCLLYFARQSEWSQAVTASFVAHAVGSVVWLYTGDISVDTWVALIPLVAVERCLLACGIVLCNKICSFIKYKYKNYQTSRCFLSYKVL